MVAPAVFWAATPHEFWAGFDGWVEANRVGKDDGPLTDEELFTLEDMKRRFPDEPAGRNYSKMPWTNHAGAASAR